MRGKLINYLFKWFKFSEQLLHIEMLADRKHSL